VKYVIAAILAISALCFASCNPQGKSDQGDLSAPVKPLKEAVYRFPLPADPPTLDPMHVTDTVSDTVVRRMFNGLVKFSPKLEISPDLAEKWDVSPDGLTYKFYLRSGVKFHNGRDVTSKDFLYSFTRILDAKSASAAGDLVSERAQMLFPVNGAEEFFKGKAATVAGFETPDDFTFVIRMKQRYAPFLAVLCMVDFAAVPKEEVEKDWKGFAQHPVGTGPFVFASWSHDTEIVLKANRSYWAGEVKLDAVVFKIIPDENTRYQSFLAGDLEHSDIPFGKMAEINDKPELRALVSGDTAMDMYCYGFNVEKKPFNNKYVRLAFNHAVDKEAIVKNILEGRGTVQKNYCPPGAFYFKDSSAGYPFNLEKAKAYLAKAGYPEGRGFPEVTLNIDQQQLSRQVAAQVQEDLRQIGIKVNLEPSDWATFLDRVYAGEPSFFQNTWLADYPDPDNWLFVLLETTQAGAPGNITRFSQKQFDAYVLEARVTVDQAKRSELYSKAEDIALASAPWLMLYWRKNLTLVQPYVKGLTITAMDRTPQLNNTPLESITLERGS
jgi:oligopeptide transport system substrate-binding protein